MMKSHLIILTVLAACSSEPHCSKFHYEEKLLEKMIRTEMLVENMKNQMDEIETRVNGAITKLNEQTDRWKDEIETLQESIKAKFATLQEKAKSDLEKNMLAVKDLKDKVLTPNIAFHAKNVKNYDPKAGETIIFTNIVLNLGEAYNIDTGEFTVPVEGIYLLTVQLCIDQSKYINSGLVVDDVIMDIVMHRDNYSSVCCYKLTSTVSVNSGNKVMVKVIVRSGSGQILYNNDSRYWTSFSGELIHTI